MGMFNTVIASDNEEQLQYKIGELGCIDFEVGKSIDIADGIYICHEGAFAVKNSIVVAAFSETHIFDKWGNKFEIELKPPVSPIIREVIVFKTVHLNQTEEIQTNEGFECIIYGRLFYIHTGRIDEESEDYLWTATDGETGASMNIFQYKTPEELRERLQSAIESDVEGFGRALNEVKKKIRAAGITLPINSKS